MKRIALAVMLLFIAVPAFGQGVVKTQPQNVGIAANGSSTITASSTFQSIFAALTGSQYRTSCTIQNNGNKTMFVFFGAIANATTGKSVTITPGQSVSCVASRVASLNPCAVSGLFPCTAHGNTKKPILAK